MSIVVVPKGVMIIPINMMTNGSLTPTTDYYYLLLHYRTPESEHYEKEVASKIPTNQRLGLAMSLAWDNR